MIGRTVFVLLFVIASAACAASRAVPVSPVPDPEGQTSVRLLPRDGAPPLVEGMAMTPAYASADNAPPEYPAHALKAGCRDGTVPVRVYIGTDGNVADQRDVPDRPLPSDPCHMTFRAAVQSAVAAWRFAPAFRLKEVAGPDLDHDGRSDFPRWEQEPVAIHLDFEFSFSVVDGKGVVRPQPRSP